MENVAGSGMQLLDCALSVNEIKGLPAIPEDVCSVRKRLQKLQQEKGEPLKYFLRVNLQAGPVALSNGILSYFALGLYHWLSPAPTGIILQLSAETLTALFAMMQRVQGPQKQYVSAYHVLDADQEKEAGNRLMWSEPVKVKHWAERLDTGMHILFPGVQISGLVGLRSDSVKPVRTPVAILGSLGVCIYVPASRHWLISYSPIHLD